MIKTSYFARIKGSKKLQDRAVAICLYPPKGWTGLVAKELCPSKSLLEWWKNCKQTPLDVGTYTKRYYKETLSKLDPDEIYKKYNNKLLVCFESYDKFCHRHLVAEWLRENGHKCNELIK